MLWYIAKRLLYIIPETLAVAIGTFLLLRVMPIDPVSKFVGMFATKEAYAMAQAKLGLDLPVLSQMGQFVSGMVKGDLGRSWTSQLPVVQEIAVRLPITVQLTVLAFLLAIVISIPVGLAIAARPGGRLDNAVTGYSLFSGSQPDFWWGLLFIFLLYFKARWFPAPLGLTSLGAEMPTPVTNFILIDALLARNLATFWDAASHLILPVITLAFVITGPIIKMVRRSAIEAFASDWVLLSKACGLRHRTVRWQTVRVSIAPALTLCGILFGFMLGGAVLIESIFSLDGIGLYALQRTLSGDFPAIQGAVAVMTAFSLVVYISMDVLHALLDPRVGSQTAH